jgi:FAD/FMN-containing dehydrogenase
MPINLHSINHKIVDGENIAVELDSIYSIKGHNLVDSIARIKQIHQPDFCLLPLSSVSGGGGIFQVEKPAAKQVIGIQLSATSSPQVMRSSQVDITKVGLDDIIIDEQRQSIYAGGAITLEQLNQALGDELGEQFKVLGADLTSYTYAQVGATFMTGGMGPQRRYFSDSVIEVSLHNGDNLIRIDGGELKSYAGTYGWTGIVSAVCCEYVELPAVEIAFAIPVNNSPPELSRLLQHLSSFAYLKIQNGKVLSHNGGTNLILGLEHITIDAMQPFVESGDNDLTKRATQLQANCKTANADGLIFVSGYSHLPVDEFLFELVDDVDADEFTIAGIALDHTEIFNDPNQMRAVREGVPFAARIQAPKGRFIFKYHTDVNIRLNQDCVADAMDRLWRANQQYVESIDQYIRSHAELTGQIIVYGHLNPYGVDPHNRITLACDDAATYQRAVADIHTFREELIRRLKALCDDTGSCFIGGEKSAGSEYSLFSAFGGPELAPPLLAAKFKRQSEQIRSASALFSWRAIKPYS